MAQNIALGEPHFVEGSFMPSFPPGQKITTQLPANIALIRIAVTLFFTACVVAKAGLTIWSWPVVILGAGFAGYTAYKHLLIKDPLVEAFYKIVGGNEKYDALPVFQLQSNKKTCETISAIQWDQLHHCFYQATTQDGRKVLIVKDTTDDKKPAIRALVEKLGPYDIPNVMPEKYESILSALPVPGFLENSFSARLGYGSPIVKTVTTKSQYGIHTESITATVAYSINADLSTDMANQFIRQDTN